MLFTEEPLKLLEPLTDQDVIESQTATLTCKVSKPGQAATWLKDGKPIKAGKKYEMREENGVHTLVIKDTTLEDEAEYTVKFGDDVTSTATVFVEGMCLSVFILSACSSTSMLIHLCLAAEVIDFVRKPEDVTLTEFGLVASFECELTKVLYYSITLV